MSTTTTTTRDWGDRYGPMEWAQLSMDGAMTYETYFVFDEKYAYFNVGLFDF